MAHVVAVPSPSSAMKRRRKEEVYRLAYINCIKPKPFAFRNIENIPANNGCLEEKSIADLVQDKMAQNPFEVVRKPPKKRKKVEESCFVNEAMNLTTPEKPHNPYEVSRAAVAPVNFERDCHSFVNLALNLKAPEHQVLNPFEIVRPSAEETTAPRHEDQPPMTGIENPAMMDVQKIPRAIAVPFTPTINHRIDFGQLKTPEPPSQAALALARDNNPELTPSEMLSKKLVFSPKEQNCGTPKRLFGNVNNKSLSIINEEATVDIGEELECYQLQLENSINEAKLNNRKYFTDIRKDVLKKTLSKNSEQVEMKEDEEGIVTETAPEACVLEVVEPVKEKGKVNDADFEEADEDSFDDDLNIDNGNYQPFKRAYVGPQVAIKASEPTLMMPPPALSMGDLKSNKGENHQDGLKGMFRRSIRMITKPKNKNKPTPATSHEEDLNRVHETNMKPEGGHHHNAIMSSIRRSLRKRKNRPEDYPTAELHDMSVIIDGSRSVFKDPAAKLMRLPGSSSSSSNHSVDKASSTTTGNVPAASMIRNSIRRGKNNLMKNILHKKVEDYNFD